MPVLTDDLTVMRDHKRWPDPERLRVRNLVRGLRGYVERPTAGGSAAPVVELDDGGRVEYGSLQELNGEGWVLE